tara:strand:- start:26 stop:235 length:210 start_codon:yes stop_codon:yes gene_type:complete
MRIKEKDKKEEFLNMLREMNVHVREDIPNETRKKIEKVVEEEIERITPYKKLFKHEKPIDKLREVYNEI